MPLWQQRIGEAESQWTLTLVSTVHNLHILRLKISGAAPPYKDNQAIE